MSAGKKERGALFTRLIQSWLDAFQASSAIPILRETGMRLGLEHTPASVHAT